MPDNNIDNILAVDRIAGAVAVCEIIGGGNLEIPVSRLPRGVKEGDILRRTESGYIIDREETSRRRVFNIALFKALANRQEGTPDGKGGD